MNDQEEKGAESLDDARGDDIEEKPVLSAQEEKERRIKQMAMVVCICKGIPLGRVLPALEGSETVADVNRKSGCGSGPCQGERCGPRIKKLLKMKRSRGP